MLDFSFTHYLLFSFSITVMVFTWTYLVFCVFSCVQDIAPEGSLCLLEAVLEVVTSMKWETRYVNNTIKNEENYVDLKRIEE